MKGLLACWLYLALSQLAFATNLAREQRWIDETVDSIFDGQPVYLDANGHRFLTIYTEAKETTNRGMIVLHGTGFHPNWEQVVRPVRVGMTEHGWNTLSIQLPLLEKNVAYEDYVPLYPEVAPRMRAATEFLQNQQGMDTIVVVAHSQGATMASYYLARHPHTIMAFVAIGMSAQHTQLSVNSAESLKSINIPVLDVFGSKDFPAVLATADQRRSGAAHNHAYSQLVIADAYHFFDYLEQELLDEMVSWFSQQDL